MHSCLTAHCALQSQVADLPVLPSRADFRSWASPSRCRLANASGRIEFIIVLIMDWSFASGCSPPRLSTTQLPSATDRPVFLSDRDFHPTVGAYSQAHTCRSFGADRNFTKHPGFRCASPWAKLSRAVGAGFSACKGKALKRRNLGKLIRQKTRAAQQPAHFQRNDIAIVGKYVMSKFVFPLSYQLQTPRNHKTLNDY
jgi:hypothetical protein